PPTPPTVHPRRPAKPVARAKPALEPWLVRRALAAGAPRGLRGGRARGRLVARGAAADLGQARRLQRLADVVTDPLGVPPLERRHRHAVHEHLEVEVVPDREPRGPGAPELPALLDRVADLHPEAREVRVECLEAEAVVQD